MLPKRLVAYIIDIGLSLALPLLYAIQFGRKDPDGGYALPLDKALPVFILIYLYFIVQEYFWQRTLAKRLFRLKVIKLDNSRITLLDAIKRNIFNVVELIFFPFVAGILILSTRNKQRLGDILAGTKVIEEQPK